MSCKQPPDEQNLPKKLEMIDRKILDVLQADGLISLAELASKVGLLASLIDIDDGLGSGDDGSAAQRSASPSINFRLDERVPKNTCSGAAVLVDCKSCSSPTTARSVGHRLIQMLIVGYCYGLRSERRFSNVVRGISEEVSATLASRLFDCGINAGEQIRLQAQDRRSTRACRCFVSTSWMMPDFGIRCLMRLETALS